MARIKMFVFILLFAAPVVWASPQSEFKEQMEHLSSKLEEVAPRRPFQWAAMNESLMLTRGAAAAYRKLEDSSKPRKAAFLAPLLNPGDTPLQRVRGPNKKDRDEIMRFLRQASDKYPQNAFVYLWESLLEAEQGNWAQSNRNLEDFLKKEEGYAAFERAVLSPGEYKALKTSALALLKSRGGEVFSPQDAGPAVRGYRIFRALGKIDQIAYIFFAAVLFLGAIGLSLAYLNGSVFSKGWPRVLFWNYFLNWMSLGLWTYDLKFRLPWGMSRFLFVPGFLLGTTLLFIFREGVCRWLEMHSPVEKGFRRCRRCGHVFPRLMFECPECGHKAPR